LILAVLFAAAIVVVGGAVLYFVSTMPVHRDRAAVPSTTAVADSRYAPAIEESRRLARALVVDSNLPGFSIAVAMDGQMLWADLESRTPITAARDFVSAACRKR